MKSKSSTARRHNAAITLQNRATQSRGYTYFIEGDPREGYRFTLSDRNANTLCGSRVFATLEECLKTLREVQRHAHTTDLRNHAEPPFA
jgi:hypothetical protein